MIDIFYTRYQLPLPSERFERFRESLCLPLQQKNDKLIRISDKHANLFGVLLLKQALNHYHYSPEFFETLQYTDSNRPFFNDAFDFNISHSGDFIVCAISNDHKLGIDVEKVIPIEITDFKNVFTAEILETLKLAEHPLQTFFRYWVKMESLIKADGRGMGLILEKIDLKKNHIRFENTLWHLIDIPISSGYFCSLCTTEENPEIKYHQLNFYSENLSDISPIRSMGCL